MLLNDLDALTESELIEAYETVRQRRTTERIRLHNALGWRIVQRAPTRSIGLRSGNVTYTLDATDELCRHVAKKPRSTKHKYQEEDARTYRLTV
jgi:hypothetical protein